MSLLAVAIPQGSTSDADASDKGIDNGDKSASHEVMSYWNAGIVPYVLSKNFRSNEKASIILAMNEISNKTSGCIKFIQRTNEQDYVEIIRGIECFSAVGKQGGKQMVSLTRGCLETEALGEIQHGFLHALGFYHEMARPDRDQNIMINWDNIATENRQQFELITDMDTFSLPYDYDSIMHYAFNAFAVDKNIPTVVPKRKKVHIGQNKNLSTLDVAKIRAAYKCV